jgi:hypothetical protein
VPLHHPSACRDQAPVSRCAGPGGLSLQAVVSRRVDACGAGAFRFYGETGVPGAQAAVEFDPVSRGVCAELQVSPAYRSWSAKGQGGQRPAAGALIVDAATEAGVCHRYRDRSRAPAKLTWQLASLLARSLGRVPISACGGTLRVIACTRDGAPQVLFSAKLKVAPASLPALLGLRPNRSLVLACAEEPLLIVKILGHVEQREELNGALARAPPGHQEQTFNLI